MLKRPGLVLGAIALLMGLTASLSAQQLYISAIKAVYKEGGNGYCNDVNGDLTASDYDVSYVTSGGNPGQDSSRIEFERPTPKVNDIGSGGSCPGGYCYPNSCLALCAQLVCVSTDGYFGIDQLTFEIFKFGAGSNPLDPASTPPIRTISMYNIGMCNSDNNAQYYVNPGGTSDPTYYYCTPWDGYYNLNGIFGKTNGQFGFRATVKTNQVSQTAGNISIEQTAAFPGQSQFPIQVDVTDIHAVRSSPTVVGKITGVAAQPYNILYRLSKDSIVNMNVYDANTPGKLPEVRHLLVNAPRVGEGIPDGTLTNGDFWDGRDDSGNFVPAGNYITQIDAKTNGMWTGTTATEDLAWPATVQMSLDPLQVTDVAVKPLGASSTDMAVISYMLTEDATVYVDIYPPGTTFDNVNGYPPTVGGKVCTGAPGDACLRHFVDQKTRRATATTLWDGRDSAGSPVCDGNYVYAIYAEMPSSHIDPNTNLPIGNVTTSKTQIGTVPVARGSVVALMMPSSTVLDSTPTVAGLDPFYFRYTPARDAQVSLNILDMDGTTVVRHLVQNEERFANFSNKEQWDGKDDNGLYVSSGSYLAELVTTDPFQCSQQKVSTVTAVIPVDMWRTVNVQSTPLLGGTSDMATVGFELSQPMYIKLNVYPPTTVINPSVWPPVVGATPVYSVEGMRPGRFRITEYWDGRDTAGNMVEDGRYPFTLVTYSTGAAQTMYSTDRTYGYVDVTRGKIVFTDFEVIPTIPQMYNSSDTVKLPPYEIDYSLSRQSRVKIDILDANGGSTNGQTVATVVTEANGVRDGGLLYKDFWDGHYSTVDGNGNIIDGDFVPQGSYNVRITAKDIDIDPNLVSMATVQMTIDVDPLRIYDVSIVPLTLDNSAVVSYQVSEPMKVVVKVYKPGASVPPGDQDPPSGLVKRIIGVRPARTQISEYWDGTDLTLSKVPDGNYGFKIYASTVTTAISSIDGSATSAALLAPDVIVSNIPVTRGGTADLCGDFTSQTFFAPNPYTGTSGWFHIPIEMNGFVTLRIYNIAGDLVYKKDYGSLGSPLGGNSVIDGNGLCVTSHNPDNGCWPRVNTYGRTVAPGVYFAVLRYQATEGTRDVCQVVKKILVP